jgi:hypothetical protein
MKTVKFILRDGFYRQEKFSQDLLDILVMFLTDDTADISFFKRWVFSNSDEAGGNITWLDKKGDDIYLSNLLNKDKFLIIPKVEFLRILDEWEQICKKQPKEVWLIKDNNTIQFKVQK